MSERGGKREGAGRPRLFALPMQKLSVRLTDEQREKARQLGEGDVGAGVRRAIDHMRSRDPALVPRYNSGMIERPCDVCGKSDAQYFDDDPPGLRVCVSCSMEQIDRKDPATMRAEILARRAGQKSEAQN